jgi:hypothetical protein
MDLMRARVTLRERPLLDVFDLAVRFCAVHAGAYARLSAAVLLPAFAVSWGAARLGNWWLAWPVTVAVTAFATAPFVALASRLVFSESVRVREALGLALRATPALAAIRFVQLLALGASMLMAGIPWLWLGTVLVFVVEIVMLERSPLAATLGRAVRVAQAHVGSAGSTMFVLLLGPACAAMLADVAGREIMQTILEIKPPESMFRVGGSALALAGWWSVLPILSTARFFAYLDIRTRTEGWDIQTRFAGIAARAESDARVERRAA